jgi:hypothetical protein
MDRGGQILHHIERRVGQPWPLASRTTDARTEKRNGKMKTNIDAFDKARE